MDVIEFVIAPDEPNDVTQPCVEPVINGQSLVDLIRRAEHAPPKYVGFPPEALPVELATPTFPLGDGWRRMLLRCLCGHEGCDHISAVVITETDTVTWRDFRTAAGDPMLEHVAAKWSLERRAHNFEEGRGTREAAYHHMGVLVGIVRAVRVESR